MGVMLFLEMPEPAKSNAISEKESAPTSRPQIDEPTCVADRLLKYDCSGGEKHCHAFGKGDIVSADKDSYGPAT
jgi:hypothetical protein